MPKLKPVTIIPTREEDVAIMAVAWRDADAAPLSDAQWKAAKLHARIVRPPKEATKQALKLRLDPDVLAVLCATGAG